jgi:hypothetical protein
MWRAAKRHQGLSSVAVQVGSSIAVTLQLMQQQEQQQQQG